MLEWQARGLIVAADSAQTRDLPGVALEGLNVCISKLRQANSAKGTMSVATDALEAAQKLGLGEEEVESLVVALQLEVLGVTRKF